MRKHFVLYVAAAILAAVLTGCTAGPSLTTEEAMTARQTEQVGTTANEASKITADTSDQKNGKEMSTGATAPNVTEEIVPNTAENDATTSFASNPVETSNSTPSAASPSESAPSEHAHSFAAGETVKPTCEADGYTWYVCASCGYKEQRDRKQKTGHSWDVWKQTESPSCSQEGKEARSCTSCGKEETRAISKLEHSWGAWTTAQAATCTANGVKERACKNCGTKQTESISATGHDFKFVETIAPTTASGGYDLYRCSVCRAEEHRNQTDKLPSQLDYSAAMLAADSYAKRNFGCLIGDERVQLLCNEFGFTGDLTPSNGSYFPPDAIEKSFLNGQADLENRAIQKMKSTLELFQSRGTDTHGMCVRCYITEIGDDVWIYILY